MSCPVDLGLDNQLHSRLGEWLLDVSSETTTPSDGSTKIRMFNDRFEMSSVRPTGDDDVCDVLRTEIWYRTKDVATGELERKKTSLILKAPIQATMAEFLKRVKIVSKEVQFYEEFIHRLSEVYGENVFAPKEYPSVKNYILILDDLSTSGYNTAVDDQLDLEHCTAALKTLARFHGASVKFHEKYPEFVEDNLKEVMISANEQRELVVRGFKIAAEEFSKIPELSKYSEKLLECSKKAWIVLTDVFETKASSFYVVNHGNFIASNILFKHDSSGKPTDVRLVDFQASRYNSPAVDLTYFFSGSGQAVARTKHYNELLFAYLDELNSTLKRCGVNRRVEMSQLKKMIKDFYFYELYISITLLPTVLCDEGGEGNETEDLKGEDLKTKNQTNSAKRNYGTDLYKSIILKRMVDFEENQVLDI